MKICITDKLLFKVWYRNHILTTQGLPRLDYNPSEKYSTESVIIAHGRVDFYDTPIVN